MLRKCSQSWIAIKESWTAEPRSLSEKDLPPLLRSLSEKDRPPLLRSRSEKAYKKILRKYLLRSKKASASVGCITKLFLPHFLRVQRSKVLLPVRAYIGIFLGLRFGMCLQFRYCIVMGQFDLCLEISIVKCVFFCFI